MIVALVLNFAGFGLLYWSTHGADQVAIDRQGRLFARVISDTRNLIAHDQESVTVWDDTVNAVRKRDLEWLDWNLGVWMEDYFHHDGSFVVAPDGRLVYAYVPENIANAVFYGTIQEPAASLVAELRDKMRNIEAFEPDANLDTPGAADVRIIMGRPAIVSAKPIISDTGDIEEVPGQQYTHLAVRFLDDGFLSEIEQKYQFDGIRFSRIDDSSALEKVLGLHDEGGDTIGYFIWTPYLPGSTVFAYLLPLLIVIGVVLVAIVAGYLILLRRHNQSRLQAEASMLHLAKHDPLTGLPNRSHFNDSVDDILVEHQSKGHGIALLFVDLDHFKQINDTMGHPAGDALICNIADRLRNLVGNNGIVARVGGDEFTVLLTNVDELGAAEIFCDAIFDACRKPLRFGGRHINIRLSIGVAFCRDGKIDRNELIRRADVALYRAKSIGRNRYVGFDENMDAAQREKRNIEADLRRALHQQGQDQLKLLFQPIYRLRDDRIRGVEALMRWQHPEHGNIPPDTFIPIAEEAGLIRELGAWVLRAACEAGMHWPDIVVAVNVSVLEFDDPDYVGRVSQVLQDTGMAPEQLEIEVTETVMANSPQCQLSLKELKALGIKVAIDDFGTGFSSLGRLRQLDVDLIKIDRSFVDGLDQSGYDREMVRAIIDFAHVAGLEATAEGVETAGQLSYLRQLGCDHVQGYYFSRPVGAAMVDDLMGLKQMQVNGVV